MQLLTFQKPSESLGSTTKNTRTLTVRDSINYPPTRRPFDFFLDESTTWLARLKFLIFLPTHIDIDGSRFIVTPPNALGDDVASNDR